MEEQRKLADQPTREPMALAAGVEVCRLQTTACRSKANR